MSGIEGPRAYDSPAPVGLQSGRADDTGATRILDRGYRSYDGPRLGRWGAVRALAVQTMQRALGLRRSAGAKVLPILSLALAYIPAIVFVGISVFASQRDARMRTFLPSYGEYYGFVSAAIIVFVAFVAPEVLCTDRRFGMLGLYLASPLSRTTYLLGKALGVLAILALVTLGPVLLFLVANVLNGTGPDGFGAVLLMLGRIIVGGLAVAVMQTALSLAIASVTTRRAVAGAAVILVVISASVFADVLVRRGGAPRELFLANLHLLPLELVLRVFGETGHVRPWARTLSTGTVVAAYVGWTVTFGGLVVLRYRRLAVTK